MENVLKNKLLECDDFIPSIKDEL